ncbi:polyisoprenoid-binding protein [Vibrio sp. 10N.286.49.C2]|uniref:YceI family protein n=1 Tax=unclassified Vibrio TaxID=2614977 RepID=UPI000C859591|nr:MULTISPECIES: YceI family protein [unclassified Vibrio]PMH43350.1 polyisoprenoid-binding protein [Vibrio sp. 10N.286.49.C2]PMH57002.1 polyisoprenoid-binding protein [Vibrio sp. 10N.286.49.B1]PMH79138.1 polyisoprenoid-binding protein [Vibrio sp. 10N.286.48.B7]
MQFGISTGLLALILALPASASWMLDEQDSTLKFVSTKKAAASEVHHFKAMSGSISDDGKATVILDLSSVETNIAIRNERMKTMLFDVANFKDATITTVVNMSELDGSDIGGIYTTTEDVTVDLHGKQKTYAANLTVMKLSEHKLAVVSNSPIILKAADFGLEAGIEKLREVAGLPSINTSVPVTFILVFDHQ